ncbi:MAG: hypothetical protein H6715_04560 [Myxococcales bacterium]|nr:hypothetical protein [Myxococcales bacterium]MCB9708438.1 hypothetical protein [Myxococcales bacterium]
MMITREGQSHNGGGWLIWNLTQDSDDDAAQGTAGQLRLKPARAYVRGRF